MNKGLVEIDCYPFRLSEKNRLIEDKIKEKLYFFIADLFPFRGFRKQVYDSLTQHLGYSTGLFFEEERLRSLKYSSANLYYHNKHHAVYQATYDAISVADNLFKRRDNLSSYLSKEGLLAIILGAMYHDTGYVKTDDDPKNYAALTPVHVEESKKTLANALEILGLPPFFDITRVRNLSIVGIHNTYFPYTDEKKAGMKVLIRQFNTPEERKEAVIVGLAVQLADLGGQISRVDYFPDLVKTLREEMNCANPGLGTTIIGEDDELEKKCAGFTKAVVLPTVGKTANAFFGKNNSFSKLWQSRLSSTIDMSS